MALPGKSRLAVPRNASHGSHGLFGPGWAGFGRRVQAWRGSRGVACRHREAWCFVATQSGTGTARLAVHGWCGNARQSRPGLFRHGEGGKVWPGNAVRWRPGTARQSCVTARFGMAVLAWFGTGGLAGHGVEGNAVEDGLSGSGCSRRVMAKQGSRGECRLFGRGGEGNATQSRPVASGSGGAR